MSEERICLNCEFRKISLYSGPCNICEAHNEWKPKEVKETPWIEKFCHNCEHWTVYKDDEPCVSCNDYEKWVRKVEEVKEVKEPIKEKPLPGYQNWYINFEIDKQLKVIRNEQNDFEVEVKAALSDMEKGLIRIQSRLDKHIKPDIIKPDPRRLCGNCRYEHDNGFNKPCCDCDGHNEWAPKMEGCECLD